MGWIGLGWVENFQIPLGLCNLVLFRQLVDWVGSVKNTENGYKNFKNAFFSGYVIKLNTIILLSYCSKFKYMKILLFNIESLNL